jgi:hypothetical protein
VFVNKNSGKYLDIPRASTAAGTAADQWRDSACSCQLFTFQPAGNGAWTIKNVNSNLNLDISGSSSTAGAAVVQWNSLTVDDQLWKIVRVN